MKSLKLYSIALATAAALCATAPAAIADDLVFVSWGGSYQDAIRDAWIKPFSEKSGINVLEETDPVTAKIKSMVATNSVTWDIVTDGETGVLRAARDGLIEEITSDMVDQSHVYEQMRNAYGVPSEVFSTAFAFSTEAFPDGGDQPSSWVDFFDTEKFPGKRALRNQPGTILEAALIADGVPIDQVTEVLKTSEGQDRAFRKIEEIKPHVALWWSSGAQPAQALGSGEVVMSNGWNGRLQTGIDEGLPIEMVWNGAVAELGYFMLVKGAPNREAAIKFLNHMIAPDAQAEFHKYVSYGPVTPDAWDLIPKDAWSRLPSSPDILAQSVLLDAEWWVDNGEAMRERYQAVISE